MTYIKIFAVEGSHLFIHLFIVQVGLYVMLVVLKPYSTALAQIREINTMTENVVVVNSAEYG